MFGWLQVQESKPKSKSPNPSLGKTGFQNPSQKSEKPRSRVLKTPGVSPAAFEGSLRPLRCSRNLSSDPPCPLCAPQKRARKTISSIARRCAGTPEVIVDPLHRARARACSCDRKSYLWPKAPKNAARAHESTRASQASITQDVWPPEDSGRRGFVQKGGDRHLPLPGLHNTVDSGSSERAMTSGSMVPLDGSGRW